MWYDFVEQRTFYTAVWSLDRLNCSDEIFRFRLLELNRL